MEFVIKLPELSSLSFILSKYATHTHRHTLEDILESKSMLQKGHLLLSPVPSSKQHKSCRVKVYWATSRAQQQIFRGLKVESSQSSSGGKITDQPPCLNDIRSKGSRKKQMSLIIETSREMEMKVWGDDAGGKTFHQRVPTLSRQISGRRRSVCLLEGCISSSFILVYD